MRVRSVDLTDYQISLETKIFFPVPVTGGQLREAFERVAGNSFLAEPDFEIGETGDMLSTEPDWGLSNTEVHWTEEILLFTGAELTERMVSPESWYNAIRIGIKKDTGGGLVPAAASRGTLDGKKTLIQFGNMLIEELCKVVPGMTTAATVNLTKNMRGRASIVVRFKCKHCGMGVQTNIGPCPACGAPLGNDAIIDRWLE